MSEARRKINLEVDLEDNSYKKIIVNQYESVTLVIDVLKNDNYTPDKLSVNFSNPLGESVPINTAAVTSNLSKFTIKFPRSCFAVEGSALCQLSIQNGENFKFSFPIQIIIVKSAMGNGTYKGDDLLQELKDAIYQASKNKSNLDESNKTALNNINTLRTTFNNSFNSLTNHKQNLKDELTEHTESKKNELNNLRNSILNDINAAKTNAINAIKAAGGINADTVAENAAAIEELKVVKNWYDNQISSTSWDYVQNLSLNLISFIDEYQGTFYSMFGPVSIPTYPPSWVRMFADSMFPDFMITLNPKSPAENYYILGEWEAFGQGRVLVGAGTGKDINNVTKTFAGGETGGEYNHANTVEEMPKHKHEQYVGANSGSWGVRADYNADSNCEAYPQGTTGETGGGKPHNNIQPYITVYMWKRKKLYQDQALEPGYTEPNYEPY